MKEYIDSYSYSGRPAQQHFQYSGTQRNGATGNTGTGPSPISRPKLARQPLLYPLLPEAMFTPARVDTRQNSSCI